MEEIRQIARRFFVYREHESNSNPVRVAWLSDRIDIVGPGAPFGTVNPEILGLNGVTDYRNPNLARAMRSSGFIRQCGVGIPIDRRCFQEAVYPDLMFHSICEPMSRDLSVNASILT